MQSTLNPAGAVYAFICWLTAREEQTVLSRNDNAMPAIEMAKKFTEVQKLEYQKDWPEAMVPMHDVNIALRRGLDTLTNEEALECLRIHYANNPKITGLQLESVFGGAVRYTFKAAGSAQWNKGARRIEDFGFKVFNHLLSLGFNLK